MKVSQETIDSVVGLYKPGYRYLKEAYVEFPISMGLFQLGTTEYCEGVRHLTDVEAQLCLNQLAYVFFGQAVVAEKRWECLKDLTFDKYLELRKENMFITKSRKEFHRQTDSKEPFYGSMHLMRIKKHGNIYLAKMTFDFNEGAADGELSLVLKI